jgi:hypothetical protein
LTNACTKVLADTSQGTSGNGSSAAVAWLTLQSWSSIPQHDQPFCPRHHYGHVLMEGRLSQRTDAEERPGLVKFQVPPPPAGHAYSYLNFSEHLSYEHNARTLSAWLDAFDLVAVPGVG